MSQGSDKGKIACCKGGFKNSETRRKTFPPASLYSLYKRGSGGDGGVFHIKRVLIFSFTARLFHDYRETIVYL